MNRRKFLAVTGVAAAGVGGAGVAGVTRRESTTDRDTEPASRQDRSAEQSHAGGATETEPSLESRVADAAGLLVFTYDDSPVEDYTLTYRIHQEYDVPGCIAACPGLMETSAAHLSPAQLTELAAAGWGVLSHTADHRVLGEIPLTAAAADGDERLAVDWNRHGDFEGDPLVVSDEDREVPTTVAGADSDAAGQYIELAEPLDGPISDAGTVRHPAEFMQTVLERTDAQLEAWGLDVTGFVYPYTRYHGVVEDVVREQYDAVANHRYGGGHNALAELDPTTMQRRYIETDKATEAELDAFMETAADEAVLAIVGGHSQFETLTADRIRYTIETALEHDLAIVTLAEALEALDRGLQ
ncbi:polysaccharide deacetylase family protein [Natronococcus occultus]|uniref:Polysaccharide deacetylase n=1 Tax=Natronococcus occultus SP4 TaxID=694430 RepID=L0K2R4_9EURY|nr:polysaccharide deacetylase family protein [Natronococcus occultus]AGB38825.1 Polysaccharide deacetylase [Natronococcus occultus SP4]